MSPAESTSGRNEDRICELDSHFGSTFRFGTGRLVTAEHIQNMGKQTKRGRRARLSLYPFSTMTGVVRNSSSGSQIPALIQAAGLDIALARCLPAVRRSLCQRKVSPILLIVKDVFIHSVSRPWSAPIPILLLWLLRPASGML